MAHKFQSTMNTNSEMLYHEPQLTSRLGVSKTDRLCRNSTKSKLIRDSSSGKGTCVNNCPSRAANARESQEVATVSKGDSVLRKEIYAANNGTSVEVTVKANKHRVKNASNSQVLMHTDSWGKILKAQSSNENFSGFNKFDPLRTIHFLGKELYSQLKGTLPSDSNILDVLTEMQNAIKRVPQDIQMIADAANRKQEYDMKPTKLASTQINKFGDKHNLIVRSESCQTPNMWYLEPVKLQQHLEESSEKIEKACQQMELLCSKLKSEKEVLEQQLKCEKDNSKLLCKEIEEYKLKYKNSNSLIESLKCKNEELSLEMQKQQIQLSAQNCPSAVELSSFIQQLQQQKTNTEEENTQLKNQLQLAQIETEKYETILQARDLQVKEIRYEMTQLQEVVNEQLFDFQNITSSEEITSRSNAGDQNNWKSSPKNIIIQNADGTTLDSVTSEPVQELFNNNLNQYDGTQSADSSHLSSEDQVCEIDLDKANFLKKRHVFKIPLVPLTESTNLREQFIELKNQALTSIGVACCAKSTNCSLSM